jgi:replicative DNA helicase
VSVERKRQALALQEAERMVLGAILCDNSQLARVQVVAEDFASGVHRQVFEAVRRMVGRGECTDAVTVAELLEREQPAAKPGVWLATIGSMQYDCVTPANAPHYAVAVRRASLGRQARRIAETLGTRAQVEPQEAVDGAIRELMALTATTQSHACHQSDAVRAAIEEIEQIEQRGGFGGIRAGIRDLDEKMGGMHPGDLIVIGARPAMGKTAFMLNVAASCDVPVGIISGEQGRAQIGMRMLSIQGQVSLHSMRRGQLRDDEWARLNRTVNRLKEQPIWLFDRPGPSIDDVVRQARAWRFEKRIRLLLVDYLQKIAGGEGDDKRLQVGDVAAQLKNLGRELDIPVVALAQVKREVESRPMGEDGLGRMPYAADLAESGVIEMEADQILTLYRPEVYDDDPRFRGLGFVNNCKNRHGPTGWVRVAWRGEYLQFGDLARTERDL